MSGLLMFGRGAPELEDTKVRFDETAIFASFRRRFIIYERYGDTRGAAQQPFARYYFDDAMPREERWLRPR